MRQETIVQRILDRCLASPDSCALISPIGKLSFGALGERVRELAGRIDAANLPGLLAVEASADATSVIRILAILASGRAYMPLNPNDPQQRRDHLLSRSEALLLDEEVVPRFHRVKDTHRRDLPSDVAYVMATSGSTGQPKLVPLTHSNANAFTEWVERAVDLKPGAVVGQIAPLSFDLSIFDIFAALGAGAAVAQPTAGLYGLDATLRFFENAGVTHIYGVPTAWRMIVERAKRLGQTIPSLQYAMFAGEPLQPDLVSSLHAWAPGARIWNLYGPVEANVVCATEIGDVAASIPIGFPASGAILSTAVELGLSGEEFHPHELFVRGPSLFSGYLGATERDSFVHVGGELWYRTRDLVRRSSSGQLHYIERSGRAFKFRGHLVDPSELEAVALRTEGVDAARAYLLDSAGLSPRIAVTLVSRDPSCVADFEKEARRMLPHYMRPHVVTCVAQSQLTSTGKTDLRALELAV